MSDPHKYTVGWICAISTELVAATAFLDEKHGQVEYLRKNDNNTYTLGKIGKHNVAIAVAPDGEYGTQSAAAVARDMMHSFPNIRIGLMVGIAGGAPSSHHDIRLGDVVVSTPRNGNGGVYQYDFGKERQGQEFQLTGFLNQPPVLLRTAVAALRVQYECDGHQLHQSVCDALEKKPRLRKKYARPNLGTDQLYRSDIAHPLNDERSCAEACSSDSSQLILRIPRTMDDDDPTIHYGLIASANCVMKDALIRDAAAAQGVLAFEMEAAGLMNHFPCLVIRGICDYADSHKNKMWQGYAAMTAAAYAKDLLGRITPNNVEAEAPIAKLIQELQNEVVQVGDNVQEILKNQRSQEDDAILQWLTPVEYYSQQHSFIREREPDTGLWFLEMDDFRLWQSANKRTLFCHGMPGAGKTILTSIVIDHLEIMYRDDEKTVITYIYCSYSQRGSQGKQKVHDVLLSLLKQLAGNLPSIPSAVRDLHQDHQMRNTRPLRQELVRVIRSVIASLSNAYVIIDALDELADEHRFQFLSDLFQIQKETKLNILTTSRPTLDLAKDFSGCIDYQSCKISAQDRDIKVYLSSRMSELKLSVSESLRHEIVEGLTQVAQGMYVMPSRCLLHEQAQLTTDRFLLARLYFGLLQTKTTEAKISKALKELEKKSQDSSSQYDISTALTDAYTSTMERIRGQDVESQELAHQVLSWVTCAERPLTIVELCSGLAVEYDTLKFDDRNQPSESLVVAVCHGLITINGKSRMVQLVHETTQSYFDKHPETLCDWHVHTSRVLEDPETYITRVCTTYLSYDAFRTACTSHSMLERRHLDHRLLGYAANHWGLHFNLASQDLQRTFPRFFDSDSNVVSIFQAMKYPSSGAGRIESISKIHLAVHAEATSIVKILSTNGADLEDRDHQNYTPLQVASLRGHDVLVRILIDKGASIHTATSSGVTAIHLACNNSCETVARLLIEKGALVDGKDERHRTPLYGAVWHGNEALARHLIDLGAAVNAVDRSGMTPLHLTSYRGFEEFARLLIQKGAMLDKRQYIDGYTPLHVACENGHGAVAHVLIENGAMVNLITVAGYTPLHLACEGGYEAIARRLIDGGAQIRTTIHDGHTALHLASLSGKDAIVRLLIEKAGSANTSTNPHTLSPRYETTSRLWIKTAAPINMKDVSGRTALDLAFQNGHEVVARTLIEHGARSTLRST